MMSQKLSGHHRNIQQIQELQAAEHLMGCQGV